MRKIKIQFLVSIVLIISSCKSKLCNDFTEGKFRYANTFEYNDSIFHVNSNDSYVLRENGYQVEHYPHLNIETRSLIIWKSSSEYYLIKKSGTNFDFDKGDTIKVEIIDCDSNSYKYISKSKYAIIKGELIKVSR